MSTTASMLQMVFSLAAVVAIILGMAWMTRRMQGLRARASEALRVKATLAVGLKERVVIVEAAGQQFLIGVAPGRVNLLQALGSVPEAQVQDVAASDAPQVPPGLGESFAIQLNKLLGR